MNPLYPYQTREVRDLAWACFSPPLLITGQLAGEEPIANNCRLALTGQRRAWLERLDRDTTPLLEHLARQRSHRLGVYFEHLWHFFLAQDPEVDLVAHNLPVQEQGRTLGEFDCIYFCQRRRCHVHLELAVKFFLGHRHSNAADSHGDWSDWLGPNPVDRLDRKVEHLMNHQIRLGDNPAARDQLQRLGIGQLAREVEFRGYLFQSRSHPLPPPPGFNRERRLETWLRMEQLEQYLRDGSCRAYLPLPRLRWLSRAALEPGEEAIDARQLVDLLAAGLTDDRRPRLIAALDDSGRETHRFFVTDNSWPELPGTSGNFRDRSNFQS